MFNSNGAPSIADIAAVTRGNGNGYNNGFGGEGWWALIILLALFGGWGDYGFGGTGRAGSAGAATLAGYVTQADLQRGFDTQAITNKLNGLENGMASLGYDQLAQMNTLGQAIATNGYNTQNAITTTGYMLKDAVTQNAITSMQNTNALQSQLSDCCCESRQAIAQVRYDMATDTCAITTAIQNATNSIMQNDNANYRALHDEFVQFQMQNKDAQIAALTAQVNNLNLKASQEAQSAYLVDTIVGRIHPPAVPSWNVPNPYAVYYNHNPQCHPCGQYN